MKNIAVCYNQNIDNSIEVKNKLLKIFANHNIKPESMIIDEMKSGYDFVFVIGGDGTILKAARFYAKFQTPIFGINLGRLGFLSQSCKNDIECAVEKVLKNQFVTEDRIMLQCGDYTALNDFVIKGEELGRTSRFSLKINGKYVCDYLADGIIVSTPTGSTAYGLSAGGPVLTPSLKAFVIVPICAHTLNARPIVINDTEKIEICAKNNLLLSADGQEFYKSNSNVKITKSSNNAKLALLDDSAFYDILRTKLHWSVHPEYEL